MGRKGFDVAEFRNAKFEDEKLAKLFAKDNTKFTSFPSSDSCNMNPQNTKTAYFYERLKLKSIIYKPASEMQFQ